MSEQGEPPRIPINLPRSYVDDGPFAHMRPFQVLFITDSDMEQNLGRKARPLPADAEDPAHQPTLTERIALMTKQRKAQVEAALVALRDERQRQCKEREDQIRQTQKALTEMKNTKNRLDRLPTEVLYDIISWTDVKSLDSLAATGLRIGGLLRQGQSQINCCNDILRKQYGHWIKNFGTPAGRSATQKEALTMAIEYIPPHFWHEKAIQNDYNRRAMLDVMCKKIQHDVYGMNDYFTVLNHLEKVLALDVYLLEQFSGLQISKATGVCFQLFRSNEVNNGARLERSEESVINWIAQKRCLESQSDDVRVEVLILLNALAANFILKLDLMGSRMTKRLLESPPTPPDWRSPLATKRLVANFTVILSCSFFFRVNYPTAVQMLCYWSANTDAPGESPRSRSRSRFESCIHNAFFEALRLIRRDQNIVDRSQVALEIIDSGFDISKILHKTHWEETLDELQARFVAAPGEWGW